MVKLQAKVVDRAVVLKNNKIVYGVITRALLEELNATDDFVDGITESLRQIKGVEIAIVFKETLKRTTRVSFRSNVIDVCEIANYFGGGGHKLATGCLIEKPVKNAIEDVLYIVTQQLDKREVYF